jgi:hypothetical protein
MIIALAVATPAMGQSAADDLRARGLDLKPLVAESLGLTMNPPAEAQIQVQRVQGQVSVTVIDGEFPAVWSMRIVSRTSTLIEPTAAAQVDTLLKTIRASGRTPEVLSNEAVDYGNGGGQLCYFRETIGEEDVVSGWLILPTEERAFLVFSFQMITPAFARVRMLLEASFATIELADVAAIVDRREAMLEAGRTFLRGLTEDRLRGLLGDRRSYRYFIPSASGGTDADTEVGWYLVDVREAKRGAVTPQRKEENYDTAEQEIGLLVYVYGHYVDQAAQTTYSTEAHYWMAWDQSEETWSIVSTRRQGNKQLSDALTGTLARGTSDPAGTLTVINSGKDGTTRDQKQWRVPEVYLAQPLRWILPRLLVQDGAAREMSYYSVDTTGELTLSLRVDDFQPATNGTGTWVLKSHVKPDLPAVVTIVARDGSLARRTWPEGPVSQPMSLTELQRLWQSKGMDTGTMRR